MYSEISDELNELLFKLTGLPAEDNALNAFIEESNSIIIQEVIDYSAYQCTWFSQCYYCKIEGRWKQMYCLP